MDPITSGRIAIVGGRAHAEPFKALGDRIILYRSVQEGGAGEARRLLAAIRAGQIAQVFVLARWISHTTSNRIRQVCAGHGVPCSVWPRGVSSLAAELSP